MSVPLLPRPVWLERALVAALLHELPTAESGGEDERNCQWGWQQYS